MVRFSLSASLCKKICVGGFLACIICSGNYALGAFDAYAESSPNNKNVVTEQILSTKELLEKAKEAYEANDYENTFMYTQKAAENGCAEGQFYLAWCYESGVGTEVNMKKAFALYQTSADQNYAASQFSLAQMYRIGKGVEKNDMYFLSWLTKSAKGNYALAQLNLGWCYSTGYAVNVDKEQAYSWYLKAALQGDPVAQYNVGNAYQHGEGIKEDIDEAIRWYSLSADQGYKDALLILTYIPKKK